MTTQQRNDLHNIFVHLELPVRNNLIDSIGNIMNQFNYVRLRTRNRNNDLLGYFDIYHRDKYRPVIFAGTEIGRDHISVIRFRETNIRTHHVDRNNLMPFNLIRRENWRFVRINPMTINQLIALMSDESALYHQREIVER